MMARSSSGAAPTHPLTDEELRRLQMVLLEMLVEVDRVCTDNGIRYSLFLGTLLGAVRHGGFIPWDDDLDVAMLRADYEKFRDVCDRDLDRERFFYQDHNTDPQYRWGYARIRRKDSEFVRVGQEHMTMRTGIFLDVFPLDGTPDFPPLRALHCFCCFVLRKLLYAEAGRKNAKSAALRAWYSLLARIPHEWTLRRLNSLSIAGRCTRLVRILGFPTPKGRSYGYRRSWLEGLRRVEFEGRSFPAPRDHDGLLSYCYGEYTRLPPPEQRKPGHPAALFKLPDSAIR